MDKPGTAVAVVPENAAPTDEEIQQIRAKGKALALHKKEVQELFRTLEGMEWGGGGGVVKGASFSPQTRYALAQFCQITRANPMTQVDILGGKPYLNANYWMDRIINDPLYVDTTQREITEATEKEIRRLAQERRAASAELQGVDDIEAARQRARALDLEEEANDIARARTRWSPPAWAKSAVETTIRRWMNAAPLDAIREGRIPMEEAEKWIIEVQECNWAGGRTQGKSDPVGNAEAEKTARTRSLRRCATRAFSAWLAPFEEQIRKAEDAIEAEWEIVQEAPARQVTGPQAVSTGNGEPEQAAARGARALPVRGEEPPQEPPVVLDAEVEEEDEPEPPFDATDARKRFFATIKDVGIVTRPKQKEWATAQGFPESTKEWTKDHYDRAQELLVGPIRDAVHALCEEHDINLADLSLEQLGKDQPQYAKDWKRLKDVLEAHAAEGDDL